MAEAKTKKTEASVEAFLKGVVDLQQQQDGLRLLEIMKQATGETPRMWGSAMVGFGDHHYVYASGHEGDTFLTGFSPRKGTFALYGLLGNERSPSLLEKLGKVKTGKSCLYIKRLDEVDLGVLHEMIQSAMAHKPIAPAPQPKPDAKKTPRKKA